MRLQAYFYWMGAALALSSWGCNGHEGETAAPQGQPSVVIDVVPDPCGSPNLVDVYGAEGRTLGIFEVANDSSYLYFNYSPPSGFALHDVAIYCGVEAEVPRTASGGGDPSAFPIRYTGLDEQRPWLARMQWAELPACFFVAARVKVSNANEEFVGWAYETYKAGHVPGVSYCRQICSQQSMDCSLQDPNKHPVTLMQDQWTTDAGKQPAAQLKAHFATLFPSGVSIGCNQRISFSTVEAVMAALPMSGAPEALTDSEGEPDDNVLAGELLSLTILIQMDEALPDFSPQSQPLQSLQIATGAFEGWRVDEVAREANSVFGGCASNYTPDQMHEVVAAINQSFASGRAKPEFLQCPTE